jgi:hypothetical protein
MGDAMNKTCLTKIFNNKLARFVTEMFVKLSDLKLTLHFLQLQGHLL